ncbi:restriction endonuclease subunit S [Streptomyces sp. NBC_01340]|uniref:restriction endonuclease subunit S n=1 Tax=Streptomyces sp. NBC_01340 TaxID=2903830 RepID=UPI002E14722F|nr:restriction endonuclease subunit S [Streptomyces sp. NBC_01340]
MSAEAALPYRALSEVADVAGGVTLGRTVPDGASVELPYLRVANVQDGYIDTSEMKTVRVLKSEVGRFALQRGDVLLTEGGDFDKLGRGAVWDGRLDPCLHQNHVFRVRCNPGVVLPEYLATYLASQYGRRYFLSIAKQTTNLATIGSSDLKSAPVPQRSIAEQQGIVEALSAVGNEERAIDASIAKWEIIEEGLSESLLEGVSSGELSAIGNLGVVTTGMTPPVSWDARGVGKGIPLITPSQVSGGGETGTAEREISTDRRSDVRVISADATLAVCIGFGIGKVALSDSECCTNQQINSVAPFPEMDPRFVYLSVKRAMRQARARANLQVTPIINKKDFSALTVTVPDGMEQRRIADAVWAVRGRQSLLRAESVKLRKLKQGLTDDLLSGKVRVRDVA